MEESQTMVAGSKIAALLDRVIGVRLVLSQRTWTGACVSRRRRRIGFSVFIIYRALSLQVPQRIFKLLDPLFQLLGV